MADHIFIPVMRRAYRRLAGIGAENVVGIVGVKKVDPAAALGADQGIPAGGIALRASVREITRAVVAGIIPDIVTVPVKLRPWLFEMPFPDVSHRIALFGKRIGQGRNIAAQLVLSAGGAVLPDAVMRRVLSRKEHGAEGTADRVGRVGAAHQRAVLCERIEMRRGDRIGRAEQIGAVLLLLPEAHRRFAVLIAENKQNIRTSRHKSNLP